jgi:pyrroline-5-carboxylate reductase
MKEVVGFVGAGNMCQALIEGWLAKSLIAPADVLATNRTPGKLKKLSENFGVKEIATNEELVDASNVVILAMKPQDMVAAIEPISSTFRPDQIVISLAAGIPLSRLKKLIPQCPHIVRVIPNTPAKVLRGTFGYCTRSNDSIVDRFMERMFQPLGLTVKLEEGEQFEAFMIATSAGVGFIYEMMIYWQEWLEERGIEPDLAQQMTVNTFSGASELALRSLPQSLDELQSKVTSKKGVTAAGLTSMRELEIERLLRYSFEKAALRDRELSQE